MKIVSVPLVRKVWLVFVCTVIITVSAWLPVPLRSAFASHTCYGSSCNGLNPNSLGCGADAQTGPSKTVGGARVQNRYSVHCNSTWERTINISSQSQYAAGSIRFGCSNYCLHYSVSSPGPIAPTQQVYTAMSGPDSLQDELSCGRVALSGPIPVPVIGSTYCTTVA